MIMSAEMTNAQRSVAERIAKLLQLAGKNPNEHESAAAAAKAQALLLEYNLDVATVERAGSTDGRREEQKQAGGMYVYQRELWETIATLNFCLYFTVRYKTERVRKKTGLHAWGHQHSLVGRVANVQATIVLARYLETTVERLCRERLHGMGEGNSAYFSRWAVSWREGLAQRMIERLQDRRERELSAEQQAARRAARQGMGGASTATAVTIVNAKQQEEDLNTDFANGDEPGTHARERAERAAWLAHREAEYTAWAAAHPEEARAKEREEREERDRRWRRSRGGGGRVKPRDWGAYRGGYEVGETVGLDQQVDAGGRDARRIGR